MNVKKAAIINAGSKFFIIAVQLVITAILGRILSPADYGVVAVIVVLVNFFTVISDVGFTSAVIQHKELTKEDFNQIFSVTVYLGFILGTVFIASSRILVIVYDSPVYKLMGLLLSVSVLFSSMNAVPEAVLMRDKKFLLAAFRNIGSCTIAGVIAIICALNGFQYYALAIQMIAGPVLIFLFNALVSEVRFTPVPDLKPVRRLLQFSVFQSLFDAVNFFSRNMDNLIAGKVFGKEKLGLYNKAYSLTLYPVNNLAGVISPVLHPILSDYQTEPEKLYRKIMSVVRVMGVAGAFIAPFCFFEGKELILIVFGDKWKDSVDCFRFLSLSLFAQMMNQCISASFQCLGKTKQMFINGLINTVITVVAILIGIFSFGDIYGLALCVAIAYIIRFFIAYFILLQFGFQKSFFSFLREIAPELIMLIVLFAVAFWVHLSIDNVFYSFLVKGIIMGTLFGVLLLLTGDWKLIKDILLPSKQKNNA